MNGISEILQVVFILISMLLVALVFNSGKIFSGSKNIYIIIISAVIIFISFISIEAVFQIYLMKFYLAYGWSAVLLFILLLMIVISPFVQQIYRIFLQLIQPVNIKEKIITQPAALIPGNIKTDKKTENIILEKEKLVLKSEPTIQNAVKPTKKAPVKHKSKKKHVKTKGNRNAKH